jgi:anti-repressor protein
MNAMPKIFEENGKKAVSARELYESLGLNKAVWSRWYKTNITENSFAIEGEDWIGFNMMLNGNESQDFTLSIDFAKKLVMLARTAQGERIRNYFIHCEKVAQSKLVSLPDFTNPAESARAWADEFEGRKLAEHKLQLTEATIQAQAPKVHYHDEVLNSKGHTTTTIIAKELGMSGTGLNKLLEKLQVQYQQRDQWILRSKYQGCGYTTTYTHPYVNSKGVAKSKIHTVWTEKGREFIHQLVNPKLQWNNPINQHQLRVI